MIHAIILYAQFQDEIFACLAAVLHLGNIQFKEDDNERSHILDPQSGPLKTVAVSQVSSGH